MRLHRLCAILLSFTVTAGSLACPMMMEQTQAAEQETENSEEAGSEFIGLDAEYHTQEEIRAFYNEHPISNMVTEYSREPSVTEPYSLGELTEETKQDALNMLNLYRYIAGVPTVSITEKAQNYAQAAALVSAINRASSHIPECPTGMDSELYGQAVYGSFNSNLASWGNQLAAVVTYSMCEKNGDADYGHRRQLLDCNYEEAGFGIAESISGTSYSAIYVDANLSEDKIISYPGQNQPLEFFGAEYAWTVIVPESVDEDNVHLKLSDIKTGTTWDYDKGSSNFRISNNGKSTCFIFSPKEIYYGNGGQFKVEITGTSKPISYEVNFFLLGDEIPLEKLTSSTSAIGLHVGTSGTLSVEFVPENTTLKNVVWSSADPEIAEPVWSGSGRCHVITKKAGSTVFTATAIDSGLTMEFTVHVLPLAESIELNTTDVTIGKGQFFILKGTAFPKESSASVDFYANDYDMVSIESTSYLGVVKVFGKNIGNTFITAYPISNQEVKVVCNVNVVDPVYATDIRLDRKEIEMEKGETIQLNTLFNPSNITCKEVEWSTSNINIATVEDGVVKCVGNYGGEAVITVKALDGSGKEATCTVTYYEKFPQATPPDVESYSSDTVILKEYQMDVYSYEYSMDGKNWQESNIFTGLKADYEYTFFRRIKESRYVKAGDASKGTVVKTPATNATNSWQEKTEENQNAGIEISKKFNKGNCQYRILSSSTVMVVGLKNKRAVRVTIPKSVKAGGKIYQVISIGNLAFSGCSKLSKVTIGKNVTRIGTGAFLKCKKLKNITIQSTKLKSVGKNALKGIKSTAKIKVPARKLKTYKKLLKKKGQGKKVKIVK